MVKRQLKHKQNSPVEFNGGSAVVENHETSSTASPQLASAPAQGGKIQKVYDPLSGREVHPDYIKKGPVITKEMFDKCSPEIFRDTTTTKNERPVRSTRNANPIYVDAIVKYFK